MSHLFLFYLFASLAGGLMGLSVAGASFVKNRHRILKYFLFFFGAFTWLVTAKLFVAYAGFYLGDISPKFFLLFTYFESFIGKFSVMLTFPLFIHILVKVPQAKRRHRLVIGFTLFTFLAQHLTEYILGDPRLDQLGDYFEDIAFFVVMVYAIITLGQYFPKLEPGHPRDLAKRLFWLCILSFPISIHDLFLNELSSVILFPLFYGLMGILLAPFWLTWPMPVEKPAGKDTFLESWGLSKREQEIAALVLTGRSNQDIADQLFISLSTVKTHVRHIFQKLSVTSRFELMAKARQPSPETSQPLADLGTHPKD